MATQVKYTTPNNDFCVIDNAAAPTFPSTNAGALQGYDTIAPPGSTAQGTNPFGDTGSTPLDITGNDTVYADPQVATVKGNPVSAVQPTYATVTKVINDSRTGICIAFKNPA